MPQQNEGPLQSSKAEGKRHKGSLEKVFFSKSETDKEKIDVIIIIILTSYLEQPFSKKKKASSFTKGTTRAPPCGEALRIHRNLFTGAQVVCTQRSGSNLRQSAM